MFVLQFRVMMMDVKFNRAIHYGDSSLLGNICNVPSSDMLPAIKCNYHSNHSILGTVDGTGQISCDLRTKRLKTRQFSMREIAHMQIRLQVQQMCARPSSDRFFLAASPYG